MVKTCAIIWAVLHFLPWAIIVFKERSTADFDWMMIVLGGGALMAFLVYWMMMAFPPIGLLFIFTAIYSWRTIIVYKD